MADILRITLLCCFLSALGISQAKALKLKEFFFAKHYLKEFHYISPLKSGNHDLKIALELFQRYMHLPVTGNLDDETIKEMNKPRCGFPDIEENDDTASPSGRRKRFAVAPTSWNKTSLTYAFVNYGDDMTTTDYDLVIRDAFKMWADKTRLTFTQVTDVKTADIKMTFGRKTHGSCSYPFDGASGVLAHAFYPEDGDLHFDDDETFTNGTYSGTNLLAVAVHEIGHLIGIGHSSEKDSVMNPQYSGYDPKLRLHADDINAAAYLYGGGTVKPRISNTSCVDRLPDCANYKNYCTSFLSSTKEYCPYTCNVCGNNNEEVASNCVDIWSAAICQYYQKANYCHSAYIKPNCQKTCSAC